MKRKFVVVFLTALLALCISFGLTACGLFDGIFGDGGGNDDDTTIVTPGDPDEDPVTPPEEDDPWTPPYDDDPVTPPAD